MKQWIAVVVDLVLTLVCLALAAVSWQNGIRTTLFNPLGDAPAFEATRYAAPWLLLAAVLVAVGGVVAIDAVARGMRNLRD